MRNHEIIIIGGGVVGASVAYHLSERGCRDVLILEREQAVGLGSTGKATGGVRAQFETDINIRLSLYSLDFFRDWDVDCGYEPRGYLFLATNDEQLEYLKRTSQRQQELGYSEVEIVDPTTILSKVSGLNCTDIIGGSFGPRDGFIDPSTVMNGFLAKAKTNGVRVETDCEVIAIKTNSGRVTGVETQYDMIECEQVVVCSGAWARELSLTAGVDLPVEPLRRQIVWAKSADPLPANLPMVIDMSNGFHFRPAKNSADELLFAYSDNDEKAGFSTVFDDDFVEKVFEKALHRAPFLANATAVREKCRAGLYENSPDKHAILGGCEIDGLYFANGFSGHGVMHSPATGRALSEIMLDGYSSFIDVSCLSIERFSKRELLQETAFI